MTPTAPPSIDPIAAARWDRMAPAPAPWLHEEVARRMQERLQWIKLQPQAWCHWEPARGGYKGHELVRQRYPAAQVFVQETQAWRGEATRQALRAPLWSRQRWQGPLPKMHAPSDGAVQMLWANMVLHNSAQPQALFEHWHRVLAVNGFLMFSCLGPDSLREVRDVYRELGWPHCGHDFTDMHDWGDMLVQAGFAEPVMDMERITLTFGSAQSLLAELRSLGRNLHPQRHASLRARGWQRELHAGLEGRLARAQDAGRLALTFEVIYGHALKPAPRLPVQAYSTVSLETMREALSRGKAGSPTTGSR